MSAFHFDNLMPELILDALASVGLYLDSGLTALNSYENRVYQFRLEDGQRCVAKFYRPERWSLSQLQEEHALAYHLAAQEVAVAVPLQWQGSSLHQYDGYVFAVWPSLGGRHVVLLQGGLDLPEGLLGAGRLGRGGPPQAAAGRR